MEIQLKSPFGIRAKFVLLSSFLLIIPWLGYQYIVETDEHLRQVQEQAVSGAARSFAMALKEHPEIFAEKPYIPPQVDAESPTPPASAYPEIDRAVAEMGQYNLHIQVVDPGGRVLLTVGDIQSATGISLSRSPGRGGENEAESLWALLQDRILNPLHYLILTRPGDGFIGDVYSSGRREGPHIDSALQGTPMSRLHDIADTGTRILEVAHPVITDEGVMGAVVVDQNLKGMHGFRNEMLEALLNGVIGALLLLILTQFLFASRISYRILTLRDQAENILDDAGRVKNTIVPSRSNDEIGDLSRSFSNIIERLSQYTEYLQNLTSRLSHELRTPVAVVRSSLENLSFIARDRESAVCIKRAEEGISRLNLILTNMSEAMQLESMLQASQKEKRMVDLAKVVEACIEGHKLAYPDVNFKVEVAYSPLYINGVAEYIAQLLDKLIDNAVEFSEPDEPVTVYCGIFRRFAVLKVSNCGPYLPENMQGRLFNPMVSVRPQAKQERPHLGIGLYIARLISDFHSGRITAENRRDGGGVVVTLSVPLYNP